MHSLVGIIMFAIVVTTDGDNGQAGFLETLANRCLFRRLAHLDVPAGEFGTARKRLPGRTFSHQELVILLHHGDVATGRHHRLQRAGEQQ